MTEQGADVAQYEFSKETLVNMGKIAAETDQPILSEINEILKKMNKADVNAIGIFYDPNETENPHTLPDCNIYYRSNRGVLDTGTIIYRYGSQNCYADGTSLLIMYGKSINRLRKQSAGLTVNYILASYPDIDVEQGKYRAPIDELVSIINYHNIGRDQFNMLSEKLNFDLVEITVPTVQYKVQDGDSMYRIARTMTGNGNNWEDIWALNPDIKEPSSLKIGQKMRLPPAIVAWDSAMVGISSEEIAEVYFGSKAYSNWVQGYRTEIGATGLHVPIVRKGQNITPHKILVPKLRNQN